MLLALLLAFTPELARCEQEVGEFVASIPNEWVERKVECRVDPGRGTSGEFRGGRVYVYVPVSGAVIEGWYVHTAAHELGHAWAAYNLTPKQLRKYTRIRGITGEVRDEDYAEVFATVLLGEPQSPSHLTTPLDLRQIKRLTRKGLLPG